MAENNHPLAKWRSENRITQEALAGDLGVTSVTVWRWEHKKRAPKRTDLEKISKHTGLSASQILGMEDAQ
jgi:transcriptional regulator with XRE-family HTH domain